MDQSKGRGQGHTSVHRGRGRRHRRRCRRAALLGAGVARPPVAVAWQSWKQERKSKGVRTSKGERKQARTMRAVAHRGGKAAARLSFLRALRHLARICFASATGAHAPRLELSATLRVTSRCRAWRSSPRYRTAIRRPHDKIATWSCNCVLRTSAAWRKPHAAASAPRRRVAAAVTPQLARTLTSS